MAETLKKQKTEILKREMVKNESQVKSKRANS